MNYDEVNNEVPPEVREQIENQDPSMDPEDALGRVNSQDFVHGGVIDFQEGSMRGLGSDKVSHSRSAWHVESRRSGDRVSIKTADWETGRTFENWLEDHDLEKCGEFPRRVVENVGEGVENTRRGYIWCNNDMVVTTVCDPRTGEGDEDFCRPGYANTTEITGRSDKMDRIYFDIHRQKGNSPRVKDAYLYENGEIDAHDGGQM